MRLISQVDILPIKFLPDKAIDLIDEACSTKSMTYNFDTSEVTDLKEKMQTVQKEMEDLLISQQYQKALKKRKIIEAIAIEVEEKKKKRTIPRKDRLHITGSDIQKVIHQISGIPLKNLEKEDMSRLRSLGAVIKSRILGQSDAIDAITSSLEEIISWYIQSESSYWIVPVSWPNRRW